MAEYSKDWWLAETNRPKAPKREIGDYVESQGFRVPRRFNSLDDAFEAMSQGAKILVRSEHPDEYDGPSGLMNSYLIDSDSIEAALQYHRNPQLITTLLEKPFTREGTTARSNSFVAAMLARAQQQSAGDRAALDQLAQFDSKSRTLQRYAEITGTDFATFIGETSYSFWEYIPGLNVTIIADDALDDRYHVFGSLRSGDEDSLEAWSVINSHGMSEFEGGDPNLLPHLGNPDIIETYERIRNLPRFSAEHCPVMEFQINRSGGIWFLQYHRNRDYRPAGDPLNPADFSSQEGWVRADAVRGSINSPITLKAAAYYPEAYGSSDMPLPSIEEAAIDVGPQERALSEVLSRRRIAYLGTRSPSEKYREFASLHRPRSAWFRAEVALTRRAFGEILNRDHDLRVIQHAALKEQDLSYMLIDVAADGRRGYVRLTPGVEQPVFDD